MDYIFTCLISKVSLLEACWCWLIVCLMAVCQAYLCICDLLIIFSHSITQTSPQLEPLVFDAGKELQLRLTHFLNDKVFIEDDDGTDSLSVVT